MDEIQITPVLPQVTTDPKGLDIPWQGAETATDVQTMLDGETTRQTVRITPAPEVVQPAAPHRTFSWSDYGMSRLMKARTRLRNSVRKARTAKPAGATPGEARSSTS